MQHKSDELFQGAAPYYARHRPGYPPEFFSELRRRFDLDGTQTVLDLGCGTGQIAIPVAAAVARVFAVDPDPDMLVEGKRSAAGTTNIEWLRGDSSQLASLNLPPLDLVTMGKSFHWTDRPALLTELDTRIRPHGAVVVVTAALHDAATVAPWDDIVRTLRDKYLGARRRGGSTYRGYQHSEETHLDVLARSPFCEVDVTRSGWSIERDIDAIVGLQFSFSYSNPAQFGSDERCAAFADELREALLDRYPNGTVTEPLTIETLIATRPTSRTTTRSATPV
ncbi:class I SAM-dependent methyltransferase [Nocardia speluncae]|uniref:Class I SAM-dependent methyltransferase n=1 Tax=Nocardia speluncae TaxID=419477 RepID=A0A846XD95_9NOCA|nr:class I SAM-dependent methyltransferase [Nocardia speluncae]NKY33912.1 class I SAM-dependent methyltransferase [Nocardia speluncae]